MPSPQKAKGSSWERSVADFLSDLYGESFVRVPNSGAYVGGTNSFRKSKLSESQTRSFKGDIIPGPSFAKLNVECKSYKNFAFHQLLSNQSNKLMETWIKQCLEVADEGDFSILFMKFNRQGTYIATPYNTIFKQPLGSFIFNTANNDTWLFADMDNFFALNKDTIKKLSETISKPSNTIH